MMQWHRIKGSQTNECNRTFIVSRQDYFEHPTCLLHCLESTSQPASSFWCRRSFIFPSSSFFLYLSIWLCRYFFPSSRLQVCFSMGCDQRSMLVCVILLKKNFEKKKNKKNDTFVGPYYCDIYLCKTSTPTQSTSQSLSQFHRVCFDRFVVV